MSNQLSSTTKAHMTGVIKGAKPSKKGLLKPAVNGFEEISFSLPQKGDQYARVKVQPVDSSLFHPIFHDPTERANHIASILPDGQRLKPAILDVLKTEHNTELALEA